MPRIAIPTSSTYWTSLSLAIQLPHHTHCLCMPKYIHSLSMHIGQGQGHHNFITRWLERHPPTLNTGEHQQTSSNPSKFQPGPGRTSSSGTASFPSIYPHYHISLAGVPASNSYGTAPHQPPRIYLTVITAARNGAMGPSIANQHGTGKVRTRTTHHQLTNSLQLDHLWWFGR